MTVFENLKSSLQEAGGILHGELMDVRKFQSERAAGVKSANALAVFVGSDDDLVKGKIYDVSIYSDGDFLVRDESGESVICDKSDFLIVKFQPKAEKLLRQLVSA